MTYRFETQHEIEQAIRKCFLWLCEQNATLTYSDGDGGDLSPPQVNLPRVIKLTGMVALIGDDYLLRHAVITLAEADDVKLYGRVGGLERFEMRCLGDELDSDELRAKLAATLAPDARSPLPRETAGFAWLKRQRAPGG